MTVLLATLLFGLTVEEFAIKVVIVAAIVGLVLVALKVFKVTIPEWVWQVIWILVVAVVVIAAIRFLGSM